MEIAEDVLFLIMSCCYEQGDFGACITHYGNNVFEESIKIPEGFMAIPKEETKRFKYTDIWIRTSDMVIINFRNNKIEIQLYQDEKTFKWVVEDLEKKCNVKILSLDN